MYLRFRVNASQVTPEALTSVCSSASVSSRARPRCCAVTCLYSAIFAFSSASETMILSRSAACSRSDRLTRPVSTVSLSSRVAVLL